MNLTFKSYMLLLSLLLVTGKVFAGWSGSWLLAFLPVVGFFCQLAFVLAAAWFTATTGNVLKKAADKVAESDGARPLGPRRPTGLPARH